MTVFRNQKACAIWIFMAVWMSFLGIMTYVTARAGPPGTRRSPFAVERRRVEAVDVPAAGVEYGKDSDGGAPAAPSHS